MARRPVVPGLDNALLIEIFNLLWTKPMHASDIQWALVGWWPIREIKQHLNALERAGMVERRFQGNVHLYSCVGAPLSLATREDVERWLAS